MNKCHWPLVIWSTDHLSVILSGTWDLAFSVLSSFTTLCYFHSNNLHCIRYSLWVCTCPDDSPSYWRLAPCSECLHLSISSVSSWASICMKFNCSLFLMSPAGREGGSTVCSEWRHHGLGRWYPRTGPPWGRKHFSRHRDTRRGQSCCLNHLMSHRQASLFCSVFPVWHGWCSRTSSHPHHWVLLGMRLPHGILPPTLGSQSGSCW